MNGTTLPPDEGTRQVRVELFIRKDIYEAAMTRALSQGETLASVTRAAYYAAAAEAVPVAEPKIRPRSYGEERERIRFTVPPAQRDSARKRIEASGVSVPAAVEKLLRRYINGGTIVGVDPSDQ